MRRLASFIVAACALVCGCRPDGAVEPGGPIAAAPAEDEPLRVAPLPVQQAEAYAETVTGLFASLADFEGAPGGEPGHAQVRHFSIQGDRPGGQCKFVVNVTRTGVGALEVTLPVAGELVFAIPHVRDFTGYKLLSMALYSRTLRDDLTVTLRTEGAPWRSHRTLVRPGWNNVLFDIQRLSRVKGLDISSVRSIAVGFADAAGPVWFNVDDIMLIDNARTIGPTPPGVVLRKSGLDYTLELPGRRGQIVLRQGADGLWRMGAHQAQVRLAGPGLKLPASGEHLELMGRRRVGAVEVLEHNAVRLRLANTWYFPRRAGHWASLAVRRIRWEHTFYGDGRWVTSGLLNNAGGQEIAAAGLFLPAKAAWASAGVSDHFLPGDFAGEVGRWRCLIPPDGPKAGVIMGNYLRPGRIERTIAATGVFAPGDTGRDGFDESTGCFFLAARAGHCRFTLHPPAGGVWNPVFVVWGQWAGRVNVGCEGLAVRNRIRRADGSVLFMLEGLIRRPTAVEVAGKVALLGGD